MKGKIKIKLIISLVLFSFSPQMVFMVSVRSTTIQCTAETRIYIHRLRWWDGMGYDRMYDAKEYVSIYTICTYVCMYTKL